MNWSIRALASSRDGNFATIAALLLMPIVMLIGFATDYASMSRARSALQSATDAAVLAVAREGAGLPEREANDIARKFLATQLLQKPFTFSLKRDGERIVLDARTDAETNFDSLLTGVDWTVAAQSTSQVATLGFEIGLVLDTTGSMAGGKMAAMKDAVLGLIDTMAANVSVPGKLKFALIPFSTFVNVGPQNGPRFDDDLRQIDSTGANWLDLEGDNALPQPELSDGASRFQIYQNMSQTWPGCVESRYAPGRNYDIDDTPPVAANPESLFVPTFAPDEPDAGFYNSYIVSNSVPYDSSAAQRRQRWTKYGADADSSGRPVNRGRLRRTSESEDSPRSSPIVIDDSMSSYWLQPKGPGIGCASQPVVPLTSNFAALKQKVQALEANGNTNLTEGVAWGMRVLSPGKPFTEGVPYARKTIRKILIVLTDGTNTMGINTRPYGSQYSSYGYLADGRINVGGSTEEDMAGAMNGRTLAACDVAKKAGMDVYTIRLEEPNVTTGTLLHDCASKPENYFDVPNRSQLDEAFKGIKDTITTVRLAS